MANQTNNYSSTNGSITETSRLVIIERYMSIYGPFVLTTLGIIGNVLSILVFLSPRYRRQSSHFYLLSLALSDLCFLIINLVEDTFRNHNELYQSRINILDHSSSIICIFVQYARNITRLLSSWIIVSFTIERLLVVFYPLKRAVICRRKIARFVVTILFFLSFLININVPFHYGITNAANNINESICDILPKYRSIYMTFAISTMLTVYLVPMCIIGVVNMLICCKLWSKSLLTEKDENHHHQSKKTRHSMKFLSCLKSPSSSSNPRTEIEQSNKSQTSSISQYQSMRPLISTEINASSKIDETNDENTKSCLTPLSSTSSNVKQSSTQVKNYIQSRTNRVTVTLLLVSCSFLLLNSPYCAIWIANYIQGFRNSTLKSIKEITELFMLTNFCINFVLYCLSGKVFRSELSSLLRCRWKELYNRHDGERGSKNFRPKSNIQLKETKQKNYLSRNLR